jgi:hypothetical protein
MTKIVRNALRTLCTIPCLGIASAFAQQNDLPAARPHAPIGFILVEEQWDMLSDEPGRHIGRARDAYLMMDARNAAAELRKTAVHVRVAAEHASERTKNALVRSERELEQMSRQVEAGTYRSMEEFDFATARALHALANDQYVKSASAWRKRELKQSGRYLKAAADNLERAAARADTATKQTAAVVVKDSRLVSGKLIEGTGFAMDEVGSSLESMGHAIERLGTRVEHTNKQ